MAKLTNVQREELRVILALVEEANALVVGEVANKLDQATTRLASLIVSN